jgi:uncharacterized protein YciI
MDFIHKHRLIGIFKVAPLLLCLTVCVQLNAQNTNPSYDETLAKKLGADDYGMRYYVLVILKIGPNVSEDKEARQQAFQGHMSNMKTMVKNNQSVVAGPFEQNDEEYRGLFILNAKTKEEAKEILDTDPAIKAKYLEPELYMWYGSAALSQYLEASDKIWRIGY